PRPSELASQTASAWKKEVTRSAGVLSAMLAHEIKNPLSSIRGAAQCLRDELPVAQRSLTDLICMETERICSLVDHMEIFSAGAPPLHALNVHEALRYVIALTTSGSMATPVRIVEHYDPSLPD